MSKLRTCHACTMLSHGVKFRIAPRHTCEREPQKIHIPKVDPMKSFKVMIQKGGIIETKKALLVRCVKQVIEGVTISGGYEIWIPGGMIESVFNRFSNIPFVYVPGWKLNEVLKHFTMEQLRNSKT